MSGFVEGIDRSQSSLFPAQLEDYVAEDNAVRAVDALVEGLDLGKLGFGRVEPLEKGRPCYHPATLLKIYIFGLQRAAGPYRWAISDYMRRSIGSSIRLLRRRAAGAGQVHQG